MSVTVERLVADIEADPSGAIRGLTTFDTALSAVTRNRTADLDVDTGSAMGDLASISTAADVASRDRTITIDVDRGGFDSLFNLGGRSTSILGGMAGAATQAGGAVGSLGGLAGSTAGSLGKLGDSAGDAGGGLGSLSKTAQGAGGGMGSAASAGFGLMTSLIGLIAQLYILMGILSVLPGLFAALAAGAGILYAALAPLLGLLGAIPVALGVLGGALGAIAFVAMPVINAFTAMGAAQDQAGQKADDLARRQRELAAAHRSLREATIGVARAERELAEARENLAEAPAEAAEALADQRLAVRQAILSEKQAVLQLQQAQQNLNRIQNATQDSTKALTQQTDEFTGKVYDVAYASADAQRTAMDEREARLALQQAELSLAQARDNSEDQQKKLNEMEEKGIKNSDVMVAARNRLIDAEFRLASAHDAVAAAQDRIKEAQERLKNGTADQSAAMKNLNDAMAALTPTGQDFVRFLYDEFKPALGDISKEVQDAMIPGLRRGFEAILTMKDNIAAGLADFGRILGDAFGEFFEYWAQPKQQKRLTEMWDGLSLVLKDITDLLIPLSDIIVSITDAATPMVRILTKQLGGALEDLADWMQTDKGKKKTRNFFRDAAKFTGLWADVLSPIVGIMASIAEAIEPIAVGWLEGLATDLEGVNANLASKEGQKTIFDYVTDQLPALREMGGLFKDIIGLFFGTTQGGEESAFYKTLVALREEVMPALKDLFVELDNSELMPNLVEGFGDVIRLLSTLDWEKIGKNVGVIVDAFGALVDVFEWIEDSPTFGWLMDPAPLWAIPDIAEAIGEAFRDAWNWVERTWGNATEWFGGIVDDIVDFFRKLPDRLGALGRFFIDAGADLAGDIWQGITDTLGAVPDLIINGLTEMGDAMSNLLGYLIDALNDAIPNKIEVIGPDIPLPDDPIPNPFRQFGGGVNKDNPYIVGERGPELFVPSSQGRIMPTVPTREFMQSKGEGVSDEQLERILRRVLEEGGKKVEISQTFNERVDPHHLSRELAWSLG